MTKDGEPQEWVGFSPVGFAPHFYSYMGFPDGSWVRCVLEQGFFLLLFYSVCFWRQGFK